MIDLVLKMSNSTPVNPQKLQEDIESFVKEKFGTNVEVLSKNFLQQMRPEEPKEVNSIPEKKKKLQEKKFDYLPRDIKDYLDKFIVGQAEAKKVLAVAICDHYRLLAEGGQQLNNHVMILGPTGVGKTYMVQKIAKFIGVPFVHADATRFSETGYVGSNVDDLIRDLVNLADGDVSKAERGIVYIDEVDKLAAKRSQGERDINGRGVQLGLLKLMESSEVDLKSANDPASQMQAFFEMQKKGKVERQVVQTKNILFITSGAFGELEEIIKKRLSKKEIGLQKSLTSKTKEESVLDEVLTKDLIDFGLEPEFIGRLPVRVACSSLNSKMLYEIISNTDDSLVDRYKTNFASYGIKLSFTKEALEEIASKAYLEKTGARGLLTIFDKILRNYKFELPSLPVSSLCVGKEVVQNPKKILEKIIQDYKKISASDNETFLEYEKKFYCEKDLKINFSHQAKLFLLELDNKNEQIENTLEILSHGLPLLESGKKEVFVIDEKIAANTQLELECLIKSYKNP
jgi:ATP-dependent Clp protease ATP-binding subunit ClpX